MSLRPPHRALLESLAIACWLLGGSAWAGQTAVRCGSTYQDRPCTGFQGKLVAPTRAQKAVSANHAVDAACGRRGAAAQRHIAARESGVPQDDQLATTTSPVEKRLIQLVYQTEGDGKAQRSAVEQACMAERRRMLASPR